MAALGFAVPEPIVPKFCALILAYLRMITGRFSDLFDTSNATTADVDVEFENSEVSSPIDDSVKLKTKLCASITKSITKLEKTIFFANTFLMPS